MKLIKKLAPIILSLILVLSMLPTGVFATVTAPTSTGSLTLKTEDGSAVKSTSSYSAYQIVSWYAGAGSTVYTDMSFVTTAYKTAFFNASGLTGTPTDTQILTAISTLANDSAAVKALAYALQAVVPVTPTYETTNGVFASMASGYYLVIETSNDTGATDGTVISKPILVSIGNAAVSVNVKPDKARIIKKIVENGVLYDSNTAAVGETVNYQSTSGIPAYPTYKDNIVYYVTDTMSTGLTFGSVTAVTIVDSLGAVQATLSPGTTTGYSLATSGIGAASFRVTLNSSADIKTWGNLGYSLCVTYTATVNSSASFVSTGNPNTITLTYSTFPGVFETSDTVITYAAKLIITKYGEGETKLSGATFTLEKRSGSAAPYTWTLIETATTAADGTLAFTKLQQGIYRITETVAPTNYNLLADPIEFTLSAANNDTTSIPSGTFAILDSQDSNNAAIATSYLATWSCSNELITVGANALSISVTDTKGFTLPGTGGIGTTIFTVSGIAILLLGLCLFLIYNKKRKASNDR